MKNIWFKFKRNHISKRYINIWLFYFSKDIEDRCGAHNERIPVNVIYIGFLLWSLLIEWDYD